MKKTLLLDSNTVVIIEEEKYLLVREIAKHFAGEWNRKANGKEENLPKLVKEFLSRMNVECEVLSLLDTEVVQITEAEDTVDTVPTAEE